MGNYYVVFKKSTPTQNKMKQKAGIAMLILSKSDFRAKKKSYQG